MFTTSNKKLLLDLARKSIASGLQNGKPIQAETENYPAELTEQRATFVTLKIDSALRGCIGTLEAFRPLIEDVAHNSFAAAFNDPRFPALSEVEFSLISIQISILSIPQPVSFDSEQELLQRMRPGTDGLILTDGSARATFLPSVWESLSEPELFLRQLKLKAGLPAEHWSGSLKVERYETESFSDREISR